LIFLKRFTLQFVSVFIIINFFAIIIVGDSMICKRCGAALPNEGVVCKQCGAMMTKEQIEEQKKWNEMDERNKYAAKLMSSKYNVNKENFSYDEEPKKENKLLGLLVVVGVFLIIVLIAAIKFFG